MRVLELGEQRLQLDEAHVAVAAHQHRLLADQAASAVADPRLQEARADARVEAHAARDLRDVGADLLADVRDLVDEAIFVARKAFEASLTISALGTSVRRIGHSKPSYSAATRSPSASRSAPITTRSGCMKSAIAVPSRRNSGFDT